MFNPNIINKTYTLGDYQGDTRLASNRFIILHESGNDNDKRDSQALLHEVQYMKNNYNNAYVQFFVGYMNGKAQVYQIGEPGYVSWGALSANPYAPVQIEFARTGDKEEFRQAYRLYIEIARYYAGVYGIPLTLDERGNGIKSHQWVTTNFSGDHVDPYPYFASMGISKSQMAQDLANGFSDTAENTPTDTKSTIKNIVKVTDNKYKAYATYKVNGIANVGTNVTGGSSWVSSGVIEVDGIPFFGIGVNTYIPQSITDLAGKIVINYDSDKGVKAYDSKGKTVDKSEEIFKGGTSWATDAKMFYINGIGWTYRVSTDAFVPVKYQIGSGYTG